MHIYFCNGLKIGDFFSWIGTEPSGVPGIVLVRFWRKRLYSRCSYDGRRAV